LAQAISGSSHFFLSLGTGGDLMCSFHFFWFVGISSSLKLQEAVDGRSLLNFRAKTSDCTTAVKSINTNLAKTGCKGARDAQGDWYEDFCSNTCFGVENGCLESLGFSDHVEACATWYKDCCTWDSGECKRNGGTVEGDPHVTNMNGVKFDIVALGSFCFLSISENLLQISDTLLEVNGVVARTGEMCNQSYIESLHITGQWIKTITNSTKLEVRAAQNVQSSDALEVNLNGIWQHSSTLNVSWINSTSEDIFIHPHISVKVSLASHWGWNYLNLGISDLSNVASNTHLTGLLINDDFTAAATAPTDCTNNFRTLSEQDQSPFLSSVNLRM